MLQEREVLVRCSAVLGAKWHACRGIISANPKHAPYSRATGCELIKFKRRVESRVAHIVLGNGGHVHETLARVRENNPLGIDAKAEDLMHFASGGAVETSPEVREGCEHAHVWEALHSVVGLDARHHVHQVAVQFGGCLEILSM